MGNDDKISVYIMQLTTIFDLLHQDIIVETGGQPRKMKVLAQKIWGRVKCRFDFPSF